MRAAAAIVSYSHNASSSPKSHESASTFKRANLLCARLISRHVPSCMTSHGRVWGQGFLRTASFLNLRLRVEFSLSFLISHGHKTWHRGCKQL